MEEICPLHQQMKFRGALHVKDLWKDNSQHHPWCIWKTQPHELNISEDNNTQPWCDFASQQKIHISEEPNILRWGHSPT
jgi:hypothetical protein